jgi:hypothetical protein
MPIMGHKVRDCINLVAIPILAKKRLTEEQTWRRPTRGEL